MIKPLEERINERLESTKKCNDVDRLINDTVELIRDSSLDMNLSVYETYAYLNIYLYAENPHIEGIMKEVTKFLLTDWKREVESDRVVYLLSHEFPNGTELRISVFIYNVGEGCSFVAVPTGKMIRQTKYIDVEVPEVTYMIKCADGTLVDEAE